MDVYVYDPGTAKYTSVAAFNDNMATPTWTRFVATLPLSLAGKTVQVGFEGRDRRHQEHELLHRHGGAGRRRLHADPLTAT